MFCKTGEGPWRRLGSVDTDFGWVMARGEVEGETEPCRESLPFVTDCIVPTKNRWESESLVLQGMSLYGKVITDAISWGVTGA